MDTALSIKSFQQSQEVYRHEIELLKAEVFDLSRLHAIRVVNIIDKISDLELRVQSIDGKIDRLRDQSRSDSGIPF